MSGRPSATSSTSASPVPRGSTRNSAPKKSKRIEVSSVPAAVPEALRVQKMKKYLNFVGLGVDAEGKFLHQIRRVSTCSEFFAVCDEFLDHDRPMPLEPLPIRLKETDTLAGEHL